jgi:putative spermidine/putrescine transport system ATP-binding protein/spermidine/putrescine transport system ATP-binding protein
VSPDTAAQLVVRAEKLTLTPRNAVPDGVVSVEGKVETVDYQGQVVRYFVRVGDLQLQAINMIDGHPLAVGDTASVCLRPRDCAALPAEPA